MEYARIRPGQLERATLKAEFYGYAYRAASDLIKKHGSKLTIEQIRSSQVPIRRGIDMPQFVETDESPYLVTIAAFIDPVVSFSGLERIDQSQHEKFAGSKLCDGDLLIAMGGYVGAAAIVPANCPDANIGRHTARVVVDPMKADKYFVWAYIRSSIGTRLFEREVTGSVQAGINLEDLREIEIPIPGDLVQKYIGNKVRHAERLRLIGNRTLEKARNVTELVNDGQLLALEVEEDKFASISLRDRIAKPASQNDAKHDRVSPILLGDRIDSWFYKPEFLRGDSQLQAIRESGIETPTLDSFAVVSYGFMPTEDYWSPSEGALFLRVTNIQDHLRLDLSKLEYVNPILSRHSRYRLQENDIVCVQCGNSTGRIALISARCNDWVFPSFALRIRLKDKDWDAAYVAGYLASWLGQSQIQRTISITSVRPNTTKPAIEAVTVPKIPFRAQRVIGDQLRIGINCVEQSAPLCDAAKLLVTALIDRKVTEDELTHAQTRLEQGDDAADRAILSRLFEGGWDARETRPLFPDLDAYYETLRLAEGEQWEVAAK